MSWDCSIFAHGRSNKGIKTSNYCHRESIACVPVSLCEKCPTRDQKKLRIWTLFTHCLNLIDSALTTQPLFCHWVRRHLITRYCCLSFSFHIKVRILFFFLRALCQYILWIVYHEFLSGNNISQAVFQFSLPISSAKRIINPP